MPNTASIIDVKNLTVSFEGNHVVHNLSFNIAQGKCLCLVGESGCGKSISSLALMGLTPHTAKVEADSILFDNQELFGLSEKAMSHIRGNKLAMIFQDPMTSLNPVLPLGEQVAEPLICHKNISKKKAYAQAEELLTKVGIENAHLRMKDYAHQFSGGMLQRVMIAMMLSCEPSLLIADEPTTALDVQTQAQIINLLKSLMQDNKMALLFITHDMAIAKDIAQTIGVMYAGELVESAPTEEFFANPLHPYSKGLLASIAPSNISNKNKTNYRLPTIKGTVPLPKENIIGCRFKTRCPLADKQCDITPNSLLLENRTVLCWHINA